MRRWNLIMRVFVSEYLSLQPELSTIQTRHEQMKRFECELVSILPQ